MIEEESHHNPEYFDEVHRVTVPKPMDGERLGLTVQSQSGCIVVTRILGGGLIDQIGGLELGDIVIELNNVPIHSPEDLSALVSLSEKNLHFLIKKTPAKDLKKFGIPNTPSLRRQISMKALAPEQKVLSYVKAFFDYHPYEDSLCPCPEAGLAFQYGDILSIVNQDDPNWWQARIAEAPPEEQAKLIPSRELEEKRKAYVRPEANYTTKIGLCGTLTSRKKKKGFFRSKSNTEHDKAELALYEEVTLMKPFRRKTLILIGASGSSRRALKHRIINGDPDQFSAPLPHTSRQKRPEEDSGIRYWFVDREDMEYSIKQHEFLEYGEFSQNLYGTKLDSVRAIIDDGKTCVLDASPQSLKLLRNSSEFMPFVVFLSAPGLDEMRHVYDNLRVTNSMMNAGKSMSTFERTSSIRSSSRRARTMESLTSIYAEEDVVKNLEESARMQRAYANYFDLVVVDESHDQTYREVMEAWYALSIMDQWVPSTWVYS